MFEKNDDGEWGYSRRFWIQVIVLGLLICGIGFSTQRTADRTEALSQETIAYAEQTNECLQKLLQAINDRAEANKQLDKLVDDRSAVVDKRAGIWQKFINDLALIPTSLPQDERDRRSAPIIATFLKETAVVEAENARINADRRAALQARAEKQYPNPECTNKLPGQ